MSEQDGLSPADRELESALQTLAPAAARLDAVTAAFEAGRRSSRRQVRLWQSAAAAMLLVSAGMWCTPVDRGGMIPHKNSAIAVVAAVPADVPREFAPQSIAMLQAAMREHGVDGMPPVNLPDVSSTRIENRL
jgi:hypothetical protein